MAVRITHIRLSGGQGHEHIAWLWWLDPATGKPGDASRAAVVSWIEARDGKAYVDDGLGNRADVRVVTPKYGDKYLQTFADGKWTDNLLALPRK